MSSLVGWQNFYVIVGSSAGALVGLQFVVLSLIASGSIKRPNIDAGHAFSTPSIVHFCAVLVLSALFSAPWDAIAGPAVLCGMLGFAGVVYVFIVIRRIRAQSSYRAEFEDWLFHAILPLASYLLLTGSAVLAFWYPRDAFLMAGAAALLLLLGGIHNAWDAITYHLFVRTVDDPGDS